MRFLFEVEVNLEREEGKFASRDELSAQISEALEEADYGSWTGDEGGTYSGDFEVREAELPPAGQHPVLLTRAERARLVRLVECGMAPSTRRDSLVRRLEPGK